MENTTQTPRQGTLFYTVSTVNGDTDASGIPILNIELGKFSYDLDNMEDTYARFIETENEVRQKFPSSLLHASYLEKIWDINKTKPTLAKVVDAIREWEDTQTPTEKS